MPLLDHFHPPLSSRRFWHSFYNSWATYLASDLNLSLRPNFFAQANVRFGIEIDVATFEDSTTGPVSSSSEDWAPPPPALTLPLPLVSDIVEVQVFLDEGGPQLAGAVELVSPANKDRAAHRDAFVSKCASFLQQGIGLVMVDVVTDRLANLHRELLARLRSESEGLDAGLYATAYRPVRRDEATLLEVWQEALAVGHVLPTLPLWLRGGPRLAVHLEASYARTCQEQRIPANGV